MPLPTPNSGEEKQDFISRCVSEISDKGEFDSNKQRVAVCYSQWEKNESMNILDKIDRILDEAKDRSIKSIIDKIKKDMKFNYKIQGANVYVKTKVDIDSFTERLKKEMNDIRIKMKDNKRKRIIINKGKEHGPFLFIVYFDKN